MSGGVETPVQIHYCGLTHGGRVHREDLGYERGMEGRRQEGRGDKVTECGDLDSDTVFGPLECGSCVVLVEGATGEESSGPTVGGWIITGGYPVSTQLEPGHLPTRPVLRLTVSTFCASE